MGHAWYKPSFHRFCWVVCKHCGLVKLNNNLTALAIRKRCPGLDD